MSWESTITYYQVLNETIKQALGGLHSAKCILYSVDFEEIEKCQANGDWNRSAEILSDAAQSLEKAGADYIVICTNTMHKVADEIERHIHIPLLHIAEMTAVELKKSGITKVGLLGTKYTMQQDFYKCILENRGIHVVIPNEDQVELVNDIIKASVVTAEGELGVEGRVLVRASGTEPLIRVMAEGPNQEELQALCQEIADIIGREQGLAE